MFECFDTIEKSLSGGFKYYETIDMIDAWYPQTILAYGLNGKTLSVSNGAPLRLVSSVNSATNTPNIFVPSPLFHPLQILAAVRAGTGKTTAMIGMLVSDITLTSGGNS